MMKIKKAQIFILLLVLLAGCTRQDNPFAPKTKDSDENYTFSVQPDYLSIQSLSPFLINLNLLVLPDQPFIVGVVKSKCYASWDNTKSIDLWASCSNTGFGSSEGKPVIHLAENSLGNPYRPAAEFDSPQIADFYVTGEKKVAGFVFPDCTLVVKDDPATFYYERFYRLTFLDAYGREIVRDLSVKACDVNISMRSLSDSFVTGPTLGTGVVDFINGHLIYIKILFSSDEIESLTWNHGSYWKILAVYTVDRSGNSSGSVNYDIDVNFRDENERGDNNQ
ncbi:MAG: hypothetical protein PHF84_00475 [bacterium]|nr:hypothetical protein [bacterium]